MVRLKHSQFFAFLVVVFTVTIQVVESAESSTARAQANRNFIHIQHQSHHQHNGHHKASGAVATAAVAASVDQNQRLNYAPLLSRSSAGGPDALMSSSSSSTSYSNPSGLPDDALLRGAQQLAEQSSAAQSPQSQQIFINQSNNIYILAKYGQTVYLPCIVFKQKHLESNVHVVWHRLYERSRPIVLSIGQQQLKQDMRYRVKVLSLNRPKASSTMMFDEPLVFGLDNSNNNNAYNSDATAEYVDEQHNDLSASRSKGVAPSVVQTTSTQSSASPTSLNYDENSDYLIENWQFEIRKLTFDDAGTYQCLLSLVKPISKNITLQVIPDLTIEPKEGSYKIDDRIVLKCRATMRSLHKAQSPHLIHQRQSKSSILWYKENEIIKSGGPASSKSTWARSEKTAPTIVESNGNGADPNSSSSSSRGESEDDRKIEIETKLDTNEQTLNSILTINHAREDDSGKYRCIYDNIQEQINVKVINDHYEYKNYMSSASAAPRSISSPALFISLFIQLVLFHRLFCAN